MYKEVEGQMENTLSDRRYDKTAISINGVQRPGTDEHTTMRDTLEYNQRGPNLPAEPKLISREHWRFPYQVVGVNATFSFGLGLLIFLEDRVRETNDVLPFVMLEQL